MSHFSYPNSSKIEFLRCVSKQYSDFYGQYYYWSPGQGFFPKMDKPGTYQNPEEIEVHRLLSEALNYDGLGKPVVGETILPIWLAFIWF